MNQQQNTSPGITIRAASNFFNTFGLIGLFTAASTVTGALAAGTAFTPVLAAIAITGVALSVAGLVASAYLNKKMEGMQTDSPGKETAHAKSPSKHRTQEHSIEQESAKAVGGFEQSTQFQDMVSASKAPGGHGHSVG